MKDEGLMNDEEYKKLMLREDADDEIWGLMGKEWEREKELLGFGGPERFPRISSGAGNGEG